MKTEDLVALLSTNVEPVDRRRVERAIVTAVAGGILAALVIVFLALGIRADFTGAATISMPLKLVFTLGVVVFTSIGLIRLARPGGERTTPIVLVLLPLLAIMLLAAISLVSMPSSHWDRMIMGDRWLECLISVPIIAIAPFVLIVWAVRRMAPTDLVRAGALSGLLAGGISATAYALHFTDDSLPFVALWYGGTIVLCTLAGAMLGPRLLRW